MPWRDASEVLVEIEDQAYESFHSHIVSDAAPDTERIDRRKTNTCVDCGVRIYEKSTRCAECGYRKRRLRGGGSEEELLRV